MNIRPLEITEVNMILPKIIDTGSELYINLFLPL